MIYDKAWSKGTQKLTPDQQVMLGLELATEDMAEDLGIDADQIRMALRLQSYGDDELREFIKKQEDMRQTAGWPSEDQLATTTVLLSRALGLSMYGLAAAEGSGAELDLDALEDRLMLDVGALDMAMQAARMSTEELEDYGVQLWDVVQQEDDPASVMLTSCVRFSRAMGLALVAMLNAQGKAGGGSHV